MPSGATTQRDSPSLSTSFMDGSHNPRIEHSKIDITNNYGIDQNSRAIDNALEALRTASLDTASIHAQDLPRCHRGTREGVVQKILAWVREDSSSPSMLWLHGPAGAGKTTIGSEIAERCEEEKILIASFFGSIIPERDAYRAGRVLPFAATIAQQLATAIPTSRATIATCIRDDPNVFKKKPGFQLDNLLVNPLNTSLHSGSQHRLVLIDGIDECLPPRNQKSLLTALSQRMRRFVVPVRILVITRTDPHLSGCFSSISNTNLYKCIDLAEDPETSHNDILHFLEASLVQIGKEQHLDKSWPAADDIQAIRQKASGQFLYAAAAVTFIDTEGHRPDDRLDVFLGRPLPHEVDAPLQEGEAPLQQVDSVFNSVLTHISPESIPGVRQILGVLTIPRHTSDGLGAYNSPKLLETLLGLRSGEVRRRLANLQSLLKIGDAEEPIEFHHASFVDFLADSRRVDKKFGRVDVSCAHETLARGYCQVLSRIHPPDVMETCREYLIPFFAHSELATLTADLTEDIHKFDILTLYRNAISDDCTWDKDFIDCLQGILDRFFRLLGRKDLKDGLQLSKRRVAELAQCIEAHLSRCGVSSNGHPLRAFNKLATITGITPSPELAVGGNGTGQSPELFNVQYLTVMYFLLAARGSKAEV